MAGKDRSAKDKQMAAMLKRLGVVRKSCRCPMCHVVVQLDHLKTHLTFCRGRQNA